MGKRLTKVELKVFWIGGTIQSTASAVDEGLSPVTHSRFEVPAMGGEGGFGKGVAFQFWLRYTR